ncbi:aminotransferase-like domain-containing protein [Zoogloea dura]|uniref:PLP-dependent aminotransferase family protein n=1 Tax=Zoogloea dura TaxID=2728840 RepID=A0A848G228_9RHOO|nr:PLP-dependent aminotransferase family protein [Zoogloea dura]NML25130.1 PLP-dependent aminotransferase family protein [Zoogloea dura]
MPSHTADRPPLSLSARVHDLHPSPIREILAVVGRPGMISFAGGLPAAETFPRLDGTSPTDALQYGPSEGDPALRARIADELAGLGLDCAPERVLVLSGSQQGIDLVGKLFIDPGTPVAVESPTYLAALQVFRFFGARFQPFSSTTVSAAALRDGRPAFAYAIPTFQNPTGHCYGDTERARLAAACGEAGVPLFEDDPYRDLAYDTVSRRPVCADLKGSPWIYQGSFSKSLAPGLRLGFMTASEEFFTLLVRLKQAADLHSNRLSQWLVLQQLESAGRGARMEKLVAFYQRKRDCFAAALDKHFGGLADWQAPSGGLFFWLRLRHPIDTRSLLPLAIERNVAFMPGEAFYAGEPELGTLRLNFSHASEEEIDRGLGVLAELVVDALNGRVQLPADADQRAVPA